MEPSYIYTFSWLVLHCTIIITASLCTYWFFLSSLSSTLIAIFFMLYCCRFSYWLWWVDSLPSLLCLPYYHRRDCTRYCSSWCWYSRTNLYRKSRGWLCIDWNNFGYSQGNIRMVDKAVQALNTFGPICIFDDDAHRIVTLSNDVQCRYAAPPRRLMFSERSIDVRFIQLRKGNCRISWTDCGSGMSVNARHKAKQCAGIDRKCFGNRTDRNSMHS